MLNYINYFTEIESYFQCKRNVFTLCNCLDWVLMENWKESGVPLETVFRGIDRAFSKPDAQRKNVRLAYCVKAIEQVCTEERNLRSEKPALPEVTPAELSGFIAKLVQAVEQLNAVFPEFGPKFAAVA